MTMLPSATPPQPDAIKDLVTYVVCALVDAPDAVFVNARITDATVSLEITVADADKGRVIGKGGRTINALRALARVLGGKLKRRVAVEVV
jgi:hypothetical protein